MVTGWVVDTSMVLAWGFPDENSPAADRFWDQVRTNVDLHVPALWWFECTNALLVARRRERIDEEQARRMSSLVAALPVTTTTAPVGDALLRLQALGLKHGVSAYDAAYLDLARTLNTGLATFDRRLAAAAADEGIPVWG